MSDLGGDELQEGLRRLRNSLIVRLRAGGERLPSEIVQRIHNLASRLEKRGVLSRVEKMLREVAHDVERCRRCDLHRFRTRVVAGEGNPMAVLVFVGEGPGEEEDRQGRPFVGPAGQLLDKIIQAMGFQRSEVFIANVIKCRPPGNRTPNMEEVEACSPYLFRQLNAISPRVICTLGGVATQTLLGQEAKITRVRGMWHQWRDIPVMPTFHPSYLLRYPGRKREVWEDMKRIMALLRNETSASGE